MPNNDENAIQLQHKMTKSSSSNRKSSKKKGLAFKRINENTNNRNCENENVFQSFPKTPSSSSTSISKSTTQKKERRRALGDISNRKTGNSKTLGLGGNSTSLKKSSVKNGSSNCGNSNIKALSTKKKKKKSSVPKSVTFDQQIVRDHHDTTQQAMNRRVLKKVGIRESSKLNEKSKAKVVQSSSNRMKMKHVDVEDIEVLAGRTW